MVSIRAVSSHEKTLLKKIAELHLATFQGFFLSFMGKRFLRYMYQSYTEHPKSELLVAEEDGRLLGFAAYSEEVSSLYRYMIKHHFLPFAWLGFFAALRRPSAFFHILRAFKKPQEAERTESYVYLASIGVTPEEKSKGIGSNLIAELKKRVDFSRVDYISLETDAEHNDPVIAFYQKNGFAPARTFETPEGRKMIEFRYKGAAKERQIVDGLVSIIMPSWNTANYIAESIQCVIEQTYQNWELIIVDDCSTDNTDEVVAPFLKDQRIKYLKNKNNVGAALSRNRAIKEAQGEWVAFLDSDDLWMPEKLEKQIDFMNAHGYVLSFTEYEKIDAAGNPLNVYVSGPATVNKRKMYRYDYIGQLTMMYSAKHFGLIQIKDIKKNNDYAIRLQFYKQAGTVAYLLKENLAKYRIRKQSISHDKLCKKLKSHYDLFHFCDEKSALVAFWYACWNMWFGFWKKRIYEKKTRSV